MFDISTAGAHARARQGLRRLARLLGLDPARLQEQYDVLLPRAQHHCRRAQTTQDTHSVNKDAWRTAIHEVQRMRMQQSRKIDVGALSTALQSYFVCGISTSGVEQRFSNAQRHITSDQGAMSAVSEAMLTKLFTDHAKYPAITLIEQARMMFAKCFPPVRNHTTRSARSDKGMTRPPKADPTGLLTETQFVKKRRLMTEKAASASSSAAKAASASSSAAAPAASSDAFGELWQPKHDAFKQAVGNLAQIRQAHACADGILLAGDLTDAEFRRAQSAGETLREKQVVAQRRREAQNRRVINAAAGASGQDLLASLRGQGVCLQGSRCREELRNSLVAHGLADSAAVRASAIVCDKVLGPGSMPADGNDLKCHVIAGYFGKSLATPQFLLTGGKAGVCLKFLPFSKKKRRLYFTDACVAAHGTSIRLLERLCDKHPHSLRVVKGEFALFKKKKDVQVIAHKPADVPAKADHSWSTLYDKFLQSMLVIDAEHSAQGMR